MTGIWRRGLLKVAPVCAVGLLGILVAAPSAAGQAAIDQYVPKGDPAGGSGGAGTLASPISNAQGAVSSGGKQRVTPVAGPGSDKGGRLPGTDYPGTPFLWIVLAILVTGALVRLGIEVKKRRGIWGTS
jgi:hypothetical protein